MLGRRLTGLGEVIGVMPEPEFRAGLRALLIATAEREGIGVTAIRRGDRLGARVAHRSGGTVSVTRVPRRRTGDMPAAEVARPVPVDPDRPRAGRQASTLPSVIRVPRRRTRGAIVIGLAVGSLALSGMSAASGSAMPGDPLYGVKRSTESARLALASSDVDRGELYLEFAKNRLGEARAVRDNPTGLSSALADMDDQTRSGVRLLSADALTHSDGGALDRVDAFVRVQRPALVDLLIGLPSASRVRAEKSVVLLNQIDQRSVALRASLRCAAGGRGTDSLGPVPAECPRRAHGGTTRSGGTGAPDGTGSAGTRANPASQSPAPSLQPSQPAPVAGPASPTPSPDTGIIGQLGRVLGGRL